jgi:hypothetical protein
VKHFQKIAEGIDVSGINAELAANPHLWDQHRIRKTADGTPHSRMSDIWVRYNDVAPYEASGDYRGFNDAHIPVWYEAYDALPSLRPVMFGLMARMHGEMLGGVLITRIPPGEGIARHTDSSWHVDYFEKFYLSLESAPGADFCCEHDGVTERLNPAPGDIYLFDNHKPHWVENQSERDRVTAIICIRRARA